MKKTEEIKRINKKIRNCKKCILWKKRKNTVPGEGPMNARIMIIGQAPGAKEDETGRPFIGRAGQLLNQLLKIAKIKREKIFITSPIKCFPPKNRKPGRKEIQSCLPYLKEQIRIINPQKFILLGEVAFKIFFPNEKIKYFRGKWITLQQAQGKLLRQGLRLSPSTMSSGRICSAECPQGKERYFIAYHPAAGLRFLKIKKILEKDFNKIKNI
jgi:DNA polymerase